MEWSLGKRPDKENGSLLIHWKSKAETHTHIHPHTHSPAKLERCKLRIFPWQHKRIREGKTVVLGEKSFELPLAAEAPCPPSGKHRGAEAEVGGGAGSAAAGRGPGRSEGARPGARGLGQERSTGGLTGRGGDGRVREGRAPGRPWRAGPAAEGELSSPPGWTRCWWRGPRRPPAPRGRRAASLPTAAARAPPPSSPPARPPRSRDRSPPRRHVTAAAEPSRGRGQC